MDDLPFEDWYSLYLEITEQVLRENWKREAPKMKFEDYKKKLQEIAQVGDRQEYERLKRLDSL